MKTKPFRRNCGKDVNLGGGKEGSQYSQILRDRNTIQYLNTILRYQ